MLKSKIGLKIVLVFFALVVIVFFGEKFLLKEVKAGTYYCECRYNDVYCRLSADCWPFIWWKEKECGDNSWTNWYRCSGNWVQRKYHYAGCSGSSCFAYDSWLYYKYCGSTSYSSWSYYCSGSSLYRKRTVYSRGCSVGSCYSNTSTQTEYVKYCGSTSYSSWSYYCSGSSLYRKRTVYSRGCSGSSCYSNTSTQTEYVKSCGSNYWTNSYRCSGTMRQRLYVHRGCSGSSCYSWSEWKNYQDCGSDYWTNSYRCSGTMRQRLYVHRGCSGSSCYSWSEWKNYDECGDGRWTNDYRCLGSWRQRRYVAEGCSNNQCYDISQWKNYTDCGSSSWTNSYRCSGNWLQRYYHYKGCSGSSCYDYYGWRNYTNCGSDYCNAWSSNYCKGDDVYHKRTCYDRGCSGSSCFSNPYVDEQLVQKCEYGCLNGVCTLAPDNYPPYIESLILDGAPDYCNCPVGTGRIGFKWTYKDKDGDDQSHYWLQIATDSGFNNKVVDYTAGQIISSGSTGTSGVTVKLSPGSGKLEIGFNRSYYWRMKVKDKKGNWSSWENGSPTILTTPLNPYPRPTFTWELKDHEDHEEEMPVESDVLFTNQTTSYAPPNSYSWTFQDGNPSTSNEENPIVIFTSADPPEKRVTLNVVDSSGYFCPPSVQSVTVTEGELPLPEWKEIPPF